MAHLLSRRKSIPIKHLQNPFLRMQSTLDRMLNDFYDNFESPSFPAQAFEDLALNPAIDIIEDEKNFKIEAEMPGMGEEDIQINIANGMLNIKGEKEISKHDKDKNYAIREISYGSYERNIRLPDYVDIDKAKASFKKGMLWIDIPKKAGSSNQPRELKIEKS